MQIGRNQQAGTGNTAVDDVIWNCEKRVSKCQQKIAADYF